MFCKFMRASFGQGPNVNDGAVERVDYFSDDGVAEHLLPCFPPLFCSIMGGGLFFFAAEGYGDGNGLAEKFGAQLPEPFLFFRVLKAFHVERSLGKENLHAAVGGKLHVPVVQV